MLHHKLSDEEYKRCYYNIRQDLPEINWNGITMGSLWTEDNKFITIEIRRADTPEELLHIKVVSARDDCVLTTINPVLSEYETVAHQLLAFGITDISGFNWLS